MCHRGTRISQVGKAVMTLRLDFTYCFLATETDLPPLFLAGVSLRLKTVKHRQCVVVMSLFSLAVPLPSMTESLTASPEERGGRSAFSPMTSLPVMCSL